MKGDVIMSKELREIIEKLVSENPDIEQISACWDPDICNGTIWVKIPDICDPENKDRYNEFINKYTNYVEEKYGRNEPEYDDCTTLVCATDDDIADSANKLVSVHSISFPISSTPLPLLIINFGYLFINF